MIDLVTTIFTEALMRPMFNALIFLYNVLPGNSLALAIVLLTIVIRLILFPLSRKSITSQKAMQNIQPDIQRIREEYSDDKEAQAREMMKLYQKEGVNPFSGCLPLLVQLPVLIALYRVFLQGFDPSTFDLLYSFVRDPGMIDGTLFGIIDLSQRSGILAVLAGVAQFFQSRQVMGQRMSQGTGSSGGIQQMMGKQMSYVMPVITIAISWSFPAGLPLYWITTTLFSFVQHHFTRVAPQKKS